MSKNIPTTSIHQNIQIEKNLSQYEISVLEVNSQYYKQSDQNNYQLKFSKDTFPDWIKSSFNRNFLKFEMNPPESLKRDETFSFYIYDEKTKLSSELTTFKILAIEVKKKKPFTKIFLGVMAGLILLSCVVIFLLVIKNK